MPMPKNTPKRTCVVCKMLYKPSHNLQVYCGHRCAFHVIGKNMLEKASTKEAREKLANALRKGGKQKGYIKRNGRHEHRVVMEKSIGRKLKYEEVVHHIDGNKRNNNIENLVIQTRREHFMEHAPWKFAKIKVLCKNNHPLSGDNLRINSVGARVCIICSRIYQNKWHKENRRKINENSKVTN